MRILDFRAKLQGLGIISSVYQTPKVYDASSRVNGFSLLKIIQFFGDFMKLEKKNRGASLNFSNYINRFHLFVRGRLFYLIDKFSFSENDNIFPVSYELINK